MQSYATAARPGDDLQLTYSLRIPGNTVTLLENNTSITTAESDYIAVYDKKMLWRANLYIAESSNDWNDVHPWNVPPAGATGGPLWWNQATWGNNEWNRRWDSNNETFMVGAVKVEVNDSFTISRLAPGSGGQVVRLDEFTPIRAVSTDRSENIIRNRVAYSYPFVYRDGHFDSPFDYRKKMLLERKNARVFYQDNPTISLAAGVTVGGEAVTAFSNAWLSAWSSFSAPQNVWGRYFLGNAATQLKAFLPGLGLKLYSANYRKDQINGNLPVYTTVSPRGATEPYPVGTDCVGFAQRAGSYSGNNYLWGDLVQGWAENADALLPTPAAGNREYPRFSGDDTYVLTIYDDGIASNQTRSPSGNSFEIWTRNKLNFSLMYSSEEYLNEQSRIARIVPGDIFYWFFKQNGAVGQSDIIRSHIAIVSDVVYGNDGRVSDIVLIESTFGDQFENIPSQYSRKFVNLSSYYNYSVTNSPQYHIVRLR